MAAPLNTVFIVSLLVSVSLVVLYWLRGWRSGRAEARSVVEWVRSGMDGLGRIGTALPEGAVLRVPLRFEDARLRNASATVHFSEQGEAVDVVLRCDLDRPPRRRSEEHTSE